MYFDRDPRFRRGAERVHYNAEDLKRLPSHNDIWRLPIELTPKAADQLFEEFYEEKSDGVQEWAESKGWRIHKEISSGPQIISLKGGLIIPRNELWISIVVPGPDEQTTIRGAGPEGVSGSEADMVTPAPEPRLKGFPIDKLVKDGPKEWEVGDLIVLQGGERVRARDGGVWMLTGIHRISKREDLSDRAEEAP